MVVLGLELWPFWRLLVSGTVRVGEEIGSKDEKEPPLLLGLLAAQVTSFSLLLCLAAATPCWIGLPVRTCIIITVRNVDDSPAALLLRYCAVDALDSMQKFSTEIPRSAALTHVHFLAQKTIESLSEAFEATRCWTHHRERGDGITLDRQLWPRSAGARDNMRAKTFNTSICTFSRC